MATNNGCSREIPVYFKVFNKQDTDKGLFNEILGFHLARFCGLPVPRNTFISICKRKNIIGPAKCLQGRDPAEEYICGISSVDSNVHKITQIYEDNKRFENELINWPKIAQVAVFDELVFNVDRTANNLIRVAKNDFILIDHEHVLGGTGWEYSKLDSLLTQPSPNNHLASLIATIDNEFITKKMLSIAQDHICKVNLTKDVIDLSLNLESFCHLDKGTIGYIFELLNKRKKRLPELIYHHIQSEQMFYGQS